MFVHFASACIATRRSCLNLIYWSREWLASMRLLYTIFDPYHCGLHPCRSGKRIDQHVPFLWENLGIGVHPSVLSTSITIMVLRTAQVNPATRLNSTRFANSSRPAIKRFTPRPQEISGFTFKNDAQPLFGYHASQANHWTEVDNNGLSNILLSFLIWRTTAASPYYPM